MFGLEKETVLKRNIVDILDQESQFLTASELKLKLGHVSISKLLKCCKEIQSIFNEIYSDESHKIRLLINQHDGIRLERGVIDLHRFYTYLYTKDISYQIIRALILEGTVSVPKLQDELGVSDSNLRKKIRPINAFLEVFGIYISGTKFLVLRGDHKKIRVFLFLFLWSIHRQISSIDWIHSPERYVKLTTQIFDILGQPQHSIHTNQVAIWVYIFELSAYRQRKISFTQQEATIIAYHKIPKKPAFLDYWTEEGWEFFMMFVYHAGIFDLPLSLVPSNREIYQKFPFIADWIDLFETSLISLSDDQRLFAERKLFQQFILALFCNFEPITDSEALQAYSHYYLGMLRQTSVGHLKEFKHFWERFKNGRQEEILPLKGFNFLLFQVLLPLDYFFKEIKVYLLSDLNDIFIAHMKQYILFTLSNKFKLHFVSELEKADLIISTVPACDLSLPQNLPIVFVRSRLFPVDMAQIEQMLETLSQTKGLPEFE
ncbi:hypothetical protein IGI37_003065 [Enterococcus sp. AZ194]|uniref:helix-turn-helix domain-containing protein n=1 Tax=Enterococcus sp. AZ194 TaxID=2774629 RepID=UPI003F282964